MKKLMALVFMGFLVFCVAGTSTAGVIFNADLYCNDYYFTFVQGEGAYLLYGYEFGCGETGRLASGSVQVAGGVVYFGFTGTTANSPNQLTMRNWAVDLSTYTGNYSYLYVSESSIFGGTGTGTMSFGPPQADSIAVGPDQSIQ